MSGPSERDEIAAVIVAHDPDQMECHDHLGRCCPSEGCAHGFKHSAEHQADAILASDWLAERDRRTAAKTLREAVRDAQQIHCGYPTNPTIRSLIAIRKWLRERADRIERGGDRG